MKNLFKKERESEYSEVITQVHTEFTTAGEKLYQDALAIINSTKLLNEEKVERLTKLGFTASKEVKEAQEILRKREVNDELVKRIAYYRDQYPLYKFITDEQVKAICRKYGLIYGKVSDYTGFVPEAKLKIMEEFALKDKDAQHYVRGSWGMSSPMYLTYEEYKQHKKVNSDCYADSEFLIAAPMKDFNIKSSQEVRDFSLVNKPIPDPVVLAPVNGGYLIVCAWGEEASDPLVVNDINN